VPELVALHIADPPELWRALGFAVADDAFFVSGVRHQLAADGVGLTSWELGGIDHFDELPTTRGGPAVEACAARHPNGVTALDHVVVMTPDLGRTVTALEGTGLALRRTRQAGTPERPMTQAFFKLGDVVLEVVGSPDAVTPGPARFWGLTFTVDDFEATVLRLGRQLRPAKAAVQAGRRIATVDRAVGSSVPIAFMSARPRRD